MNSYECRAYGPQLISKDDTVGRWPRIIIPTWCDEWRAYTRGEELEPEPKYYRFIDPVIQLAIKDGEALYAAPMLDAWIPDKVNGRFCSEQGGKIVPHEIVLEQILNSVNWRIKGDG